MAVSDWSTTAGSNTSIDGINIAENCSPAGVNNALRAIMAAIATWRDEGGGGGAGGAQPLDATLTALAGLTTAADAMIYATGSDAFSTIPSAAFGRSLLNTSSASAAASLLNVASAPVVTGTGGSNCAIALGGGLVMTTRSITASANTSAAFAYGNGHTYASWAKAWIEGDDSDGEDVSAWVTSHGLPTATVRNDGNSSASLTLFSIGI